MSKFKRIGEILLASCYWHQHYRHRVTSYGQIKYSDPASYERRMDKVPRYRPTLEYHMAVRFRLSKKQRRSIAKMRIRQNINL